MPKLRARTLSEHFRRVLFERDAIPATTGQIAKLIGKSAQTVRNYKARPETMTLEAAVRYADAVHMTAEEWESLRRFK